MRGKSLKVSEVNTYIKRVLQTDMILSNISIEGELSNFKHHYSGHMYFNLKDEKSKIKCVMFKRDNEKIVFSPKEGMKLIATGYISIYEKEGEYQLYVRHLKESGIGDLYKAFEDLKKKLDNEGLFEQEYKKPIPFMPKTVGVVTSATGAAIRDIINVIKRRYPPCNIIVYPSLVQGIDAPNEICKGLKYLDDRGDIDVIITGRGGGSIEELFCFNSEDIARTIYGMKTPVISAVGHETDFTICDFVSDLRAPTPSSAAELCVPDIKHLQTSLKEKQDELEDTMKRYINKLQKEVEYLNKNIKYCNPLNKLKDKEQEIDNMFKELNYLIKNKISDKKNGLLQLKHKLDLLDPLIGSQKGYGILTDKNNKLIKSIKNLERNDTIYIYLEDGKIEAIVNDLKGEPTDE